MVVFDDHVVCDGANSTASLGICGVVRTWYRRPCMKVTCRLSTYSFTLHPQDTGQGLVIAIFPVCKKAPLEYVVLTVGTPKYHVEARLRIKLEGLFNLVLPSSFEHARRAA